MRTASATQRGGHRGARRLLGLLCLSLISAALFASATPAASTAAAAGPWRASVSNPDYVTQNKLMDVFVSVLNTSPDSLSGELTVRFTLPPGITPYENPFGPNPSDDSGHTSPVCNTVDQVTECTADASGVEAGQQVRMRFIGSVASDATGGPGEIEVSGGGSSEAFTYPFSIAVGPSGPFAIKAFDIGLSDGPVVPATHAGSDPTDVVTTIKLQSEAQLNFDIPSSNLVVNAPTESLRDTIVHVPPGFVGNPTATPARCKQSQLTDSALTSTGAQADFPKCPPGSQTGLVQINSGDIAPLYNLVPPKGSPAAFGFQYHSIVVTLLARLRPSDNGIDIVTLNTPNTIPIPKFEVMMWGNPTDKSYDRLRGLCLYQGFGYNPETCEGSLSTRSDVPFLRTPTSCPGTPLPWSIEMNTWEHPGTFVHKETSTPAMEGCAENPFDPSVLLAPSSHAAASTSGLDVEVKMPQEASIDGLAEADLRAATVQLPQGVTLNPAAADGLAACTDEQLRLGLEGPSNCPDAAKLGSLELETQLLEDPIEGSVYLRSQASNDPASGDLYRLALEIRSDERGVDVKLPGSLKVDPNTGQLTTSFSDLPQLPFESMRLHLKTGPRAPLTTPSACGTYAAHAVLTGWNGATETLDPSFTIDQSCTPPAFKPGFEAGVEDNTAGEFSPFTLRVTRDAGQPNLSRIDATLPEGELAKLAGVPVCSNAAAATGACPAESKIGTTTVGVGEGSNPLYVPQAGHAPTAVYLSGPYKSAPYSIVVAVPAQAGPFDLGTVSVRSAVQIDPTTTQASVLSDPLPQIIGGVPVAYRDVRVNVDRPKFTLNPTSCEPQSVNGTISSTQGQSARVSDRFQAGDCAQLGFGPKLGLRLSGGTHRGDNPALTAVFRPRAGNANAASIQVALPHSEFLDQSHIRTICTRVQFAADACPKGSIYGHVRATSPLLDYALEGPVYLRSSSHNLPDLVLALHGPASHPIEIDAVGRIDSVNGGIRTTFAQVPDAPLTKVVLRMAGGQKSLLQNSRNLCASTNRADVQMDAHNGRTANSQPALRAAGCPAKAHKRHRRHR
jgi:hypothetical protein